MRYCIVATILASMCSLLGCVGDSSSSYHTRIQPVTDEEWHAAESRVVAYLSNPKQSDVLDLWLSDFVTCGPHLWAKIKGNPAVADKDLNTISFVMETATIDQAGNLLGIEKDAESISFRDVNDVRLLWNAILSETDTIAGYSIRKPTACELQLLSNQVPFLMEGPILVVESSRSNLILLMDEIDDYFRPIWIEDLHGVSQ